MSCSSISYSVELPKLQVITTHENQSVSCNYNYQEPTLSVDSTFEHADITVVGNYTKSISTECSYTTHKVDANLSLICSIGGEVYEYLLSSDQGPVLTKEGYILVKK